MGLFTYCLAGGALILLGAWETLFLSYTTLHPSSSSSPLSPPNPTIKRRKNGQPFFISVRFIGIALFTFCFIFDSLVSLVDAYNSKDRVGFALQLEIIAIACLFLMYAVFGLLFVSTSFFTVPYSMLNLIVLFAFGQEFMHFYLQRKDPDGMENRYFDLLLVPIMVCMFSTVLEMSGWYNKSNLPVLSRGVGLIFQGTWFVQMGFSFYTNAIAQGCSLVEKSRGNFTVLCKGHMANHRGRAVATLQFNCHLAFMVMVIVAVYSFVAYKYGLADDYLNYKPLNAELRHLDHQGQFTLDSDDEIVVEENGMKAKDLQILPVSGVNGFGDH
ncbi:hypothetical protein IFM89_000825 [Coptis chinensis]|uniref:Uncharacterized protein n=1 Tax=Coptis chinensis TaxID=261450 RepID=A0A835MGX8_9MAGN|nr:hypothetical protein IFM89_000825 [Coptis chinensis]